MTDIGYYRLLSIFGLSINSEAYNLEASSKRIICSNATDFREPIKIYFLI